MNSCRHRFLKQVLMACLLMASLGKALAYTHPIKPVTILPGIARGDCTPCRHPVKKCQPCNTTYHPVPPPNTGRLAHPRIARSATPIAPIPASNLNYCPAYIVRISNFKRIEAEGNVIVSVKSSRNQQVQICSCEGSGHETIGAVVRNGTLHLKDISRDKRGKYHHCPVIVKIDTPSLESITLHEQATLMATNVQGPEMNIYSDSSGYIRLRGNLQIHQITQRGYGRIDADWVEMDHIHIFTSGASQVRLAGIVNMLEITAIDDSHVDVRLLRADNALIKTSGTAEVDTTTIDSLAGFASDFSDVYYFKTPQHLIRHTYQSGNVMQLQHWS